MDEQIPLIQATLGAPDASKGINPERADVEASQQYQSIEIQKKHRSNGKNGISDKEDAKNDNTNDNDNNNNNEDTNSVMDLESQGEGKTSVYQTFVHLLKGYMGAGCLSLPWAISRLGFFWGPIAILVVSYWSSYNCWTIVKLKRFIERENNNSIILDDDKASDASSVTTNTQVTYAAVGEFFYGTKFETYVAVCVCVQQLAICTVFISFVGENLLAVLETTAAAAEGGRFAFLATHVGVMTLELPVILGLSLIPNLKSLTPVMAAGTALLMVTFVAIGIIIHQVWDERPAASDIQVEWSAAPLAVCAILYSYEGINLILPVESAMQKPQRFHIPFVLAMICVAFILASFSVICVLAFGDVTSGSVTAFLLEAYADKSDIVWWLMVANTAVSLSVLLTYPLQLFPALELLGPSFSNLLHKGDPLEEDDDDDDFSAFEPLPPLPEHGVADVEEWDDHQYGVDKNVEEEEEYNENLNDEENNSVAYSAITGMQSMMPEFTMPGDSPWLRVTLVFLTYFIAVIVPNVQALISLAGALAGSSSALLIPPMLDLAWIQHIEEVEGSSEGGVVVVGGVGAVPVAPPAPVASNSSTSETNGYSNTTNQVGNSNATTNGNIDTKKRGLSMGKVKCYVLLFLGILFFLIGTYSSIADIIRIYREG